MKFPYFASVFYSAFFVGVLCNPSDDETEFALRQEVEQLRKQVESIKNLLNDTLEERVTNREFQVADLEVDVNLIESEQIIQDQRIFELQADTDKDSVLVISEDVETLGERLTLAEDSINDLDDRVISAESGISSLEDTTAQLGNRLDQMEVSGTVAFQAVLDEYSTISVGTVLIFNDVDLNLGDGYDNSAGQFTTPSGEAGLYFFYTKLYTSQTNYLYFAIRRNGQEMCWAIVDFIPTADADDNGTPSCGAAMLLSAGDVVDVYYASGNTETPLQMSNNYFSGFRIAAE